MALKDRFSFRGRFGSGTRAGPGPNVVESHHASRGTTVLRGPTAPRPSEFHLGVPDSYRVYNLTGDYSAGDSPASDSGLEWEAQLPESGFTPDDSIEQPASMTDPLRNRPRANHAEYDSETQKLHITYRDGAVYEYEGVDEGTWQELKSVRYSTGKWLNANLLSYDPGTRLN